MEGSKLLLVMALQADGRTPEGDPILAVDRLGAGHDENGDGHQRRHRHARVVAQQDIAGPLVGDGDSG